MRKLVLLCSTAALALACAGPAITDATRVSEARRQAAVAGANLIECPSSQSSTTTTLVSPLGGLVSIGGTTISIPAGALALPTLITVTVPASNYMEVDISVPGLEHFEFDLPVTVTVSYARCNRADIDQSPLSAWYIDGETHELLEHMGGTDNKVARTVTFTTPHLSGYALAN